MAEHRDATANLTLAEIGSRDLDNFELVFKTCKHHAFDYAQHSIVFFGKCIGEAFRRLGITELDKVRLQSEQSGTPQGNKAMVKHASNLNKELFKKGIRYEMRPKSHYPDKQDIERRGMYITKNNEIVYFIGSPKRMHLHKGPNQSLLVLPKRLAHSIKYRVSTNVPM